MGEGPTSGLEWRQGQKISAKKLNRMVDLTAAASPVLNLDSPSLNSRSGHATNLLQKYQGTPVFCRVKTNRTCGGEYDGLILNGPISDVSGSTFSTDDFEENLPVVIQNMEEAFASTHVLTADSVVFGLIVGRAGTGADEGKMIVRIPGAGTGGIQLIRYDLTTHSIQVSYTLTPESGDWETQVQYYPHTVVSDVVCNLDGTITKSTITLYDPEE